MSGQEGPTGINVDEMERLLSSPELATMARSLREIRFNSTTALLATFAGRGPELRGWLSDAQINRDSNLRLQFLAGLGMNVDQRAEIYRGMVAYRRYPEDIFTGSPAHLATLRDAIYQRK